MERIVQISGWPLPGGQDTVPVTKIVDTSGGCAMNVSCFVGRLGGKSAVVSPIGDGKYAQIPLQELERSNVDVSFLVKYPDSEGSLIMILTNPDGDWAALDYIDAQLHLRMEDIPSTEEMSKVKIFHVDGFSYLTVGSEGVIIEAVKRARAADCIISVDASVPAAKNKTKFLGQLFSEADIIFANRFEALAVAQASSIEEAAERLRKMSRHLSVLKLGAEGSYIITADAARFIPAVKVEVIDTVAAGDAYIAAMLLSLCQGAPLMRAGLRGSAAGALACMGHGSLSHHFSNHDIEKLLDRSVKQQRSDRSNQR